MKKLSVFLIGILGLISSISSQTNETPVAGDANITFETTKHDYSTIPYDGNGSYDYVFTNTGKTTLFITNCVKGCGCTDVSWTKEPIEPGQRGKVTATYNTKKIGYFNKGVDVYSNTKTPKINLRLIGTVDEPEMALQNKNTNDGPSMIFDKIEYDLGKFKVGSSIVCEIKFKNTGKADLKIINSIKNNGIESIDKTRQIITPGQEGSTKVTCSSAITGEFKTQVFFYTNAGVPKVVHIKGRVTD